MNEENPAQAEYFRTRYSCMERLIQLTQNVQGNVLLAFDFPFGYPASSRMSGGRKAAKILSEHVISSENDKNNRFDVGNLLNSKLSTHPGPFWGHPKSMSFSTLTWSKPAFLHDKFNEWRLVEHLLKARGHKIMNVWQLLGQGSVGSQTLTGLAALFEFSKNKMLKDRISFWPFDTEWDKSLSGIILAEVWPSLNEFQHINHPIKDARQVLACLDWLAQKNTENEIGALFAAPTCLNSIEQNQCLIEEGWILGVT